ncbi:MAG: hypothetical protein WC152_08140, partial [Candidatus Izemoplasmatales bacterium]
MKWNLEYLFKNIEEFEQAYEESIRIIDKAASYKGKLNQFSSFKEFFLLQKKFEEVGVRAYQYASLLSDLNKKNSEHSARLQKVQIAFARLQQALAFEEPELIKIGKEKVMSFIDQDKDLEEFRFPMEKLYKRQEHILDDKSEDLLANYAQLANSGRNLYSSLSVAD